MKAIPTVLITLYTFSFVGASQMYAKTTCRTPRQFLSNSYQENTTEFINYLICLHNEQQVQLVTLENDLALGRQELELLREAYFKLQQEMDSINDQKYNYDN